MLKNNKMTQKTIEEIKDKLEEYLFLKGIDIKKLFHCLDPSHKDKTPSMGITPDRQHVKCFGCDVYYDVFDLIGIDYNLQSFTEKLKKAKELFNIKDNKPDNIKQKKVISSLQEKKKMDNYTSFYEKMNKYLNLTNYPKERGLSDEVLNRFKVGYDPATKELIIPTSDYSYVKRKVLKDVEPQNRYKKQGAVNILNVGAIKTALKPLIVVEGEIDCLSIIEAGGEALGLGSTSNTNKLINHLKENKPKKPLILALDEDEAGLKATETLKTDLTRLSIPFIDNLTYKPCKDASELLCVDRKDLEARILKASEEATTLIEKQKNEELKAYKKKSTRSILDTFLKDIKTTNVKPIPTGYNLLDVVLNGGLVSGLYGIGAISSLGKTTFVLQMSDQVAQGGKDVLIFSLEMKKETLIAKSLSRIMYKKAGSPDLTEHFLPIKKGKNKGADPEACILSSQEIIQGCKYGTVGDNLSCDEVRPEELQSLDRAITDYKAYSEHLYIFEPKDVQKGFYNVSIEQIRETVEKHIAITGNTPVVVVDYLQLIKPLNDKGNDKSNTDFTIHGLKALADEFTTPVIAISSFNRNSYNAPVNLASFKESGGIEYSCDVLIGLQYKLPFTKAGAKPEDLLEAKRQPISEVQAVILKNRNGQTGATINYSFTGKYNTFTEGRTE